MPNALTLIHRAGRAGLAPALAFAALTAACGELPSTAPVDQVVSSSSDVPSQAARDPETAAASAYFAIEEALGAECDDKWISEPPLQDAACYGFLPEHVASFIRAIPDGHPYLSAEQREEAARTKQVFRAVDGYGERPDFLVSIEHYGTFWIRSFEGPDPDVTVYVVYGPSCSDDRSLTGDSGDGGCLQGEPYVTRELKIYRVRSGGPPEEVGSELAPVPPGMTPAERTRYGRYLRSKEQGPASDTDIGLDVTRLAQVPVMRWILRPVQEGEHEAPAMPQSDPRAYLDYDWREHAAHFGFLVWTGQRFELLETVRPDLWPCRSTQAMRHACGPGYDRIVDRYLRPAAAQEPGEPGA